MEISGPSFCQIRDGYPCNKWMVTTYEKTPKGTSFDLYFFTTKADAEIYIQYLQQCIGIEDIKKKIYSPRTFKWEKKEYEEFLETIDTSVLEEAIKNIKVDIEHDFKPILPTKGD